MKGLVSALILICLHKRDDNLYIHNIFQNQNLVKKLLDIICLNSQLTPGLIHLINNQDNMLMAYATAELALIIQEKISLDPRTKQLTPKMFYKSGIEKFLKEKNESSALVSFTDIETFLELTRLFNPKHVQEEPESFSGLIIKYENDRISTETFSLFD